MPRERCEFVKHGKVSEVLEDAIPVEAGQELEVALAEPHMFQAADAVAVLEGGYRLVVAGAGPYLGETHKVKIERVGRLEAHAVLLDAEPITEADMIKMVDPRSDVHEPPRLVGERVDLEPELVFPLRKGSEVANGRGGERFVVLPQRAVGEDTTRLRERAPRAWAYLEAHRPRLDARRSSVYRGQPPFAIFGVGPYAFAPYKVAICGLYKRLRFTLVGPEDGRPVIFDDTVYFLPCATRDEAAALAAALNGPRARRFFEARVFWDAKRPIQKSLLAALSLDALLRLEGAPGDGDGDAAGRAGP